MSSSGSECRHLDQNVVTVTVTLVSFQMFIGNLVFLFTILFTSRDMTLYASLASYFFLLLHSAEIHGVHLVDTADTCFAYIVYFHALRPSHYYLISLTNVLDFPFVLSIISTPCNPRPDVFRV